MEIGSRVGVQQQTALVLECSAAASQRQRNIIIDSLGRPGEESRFWGGAYIEPGI